MGSLCRQCISTLRSSRFGCREGFTSKVDQRPLCLTQMSVWLRVQSTTQISEVLRPNQNYELGLRVEAEVCASHHPVSFTLRNRQGNGEETKDVGQGVEGLHTSQVNLFTESTQANLENFLCGLCVSLVFGSPGAYSQGSTFQYGGTLWEMNDKVSTGLEEASSGPWGQDGTDSSEPRAAGISFYVTAECVGVEMLDCPTPGFLQALEGQLHTGEAAPCRIVSESTISYEISVGETTDSELSSELPKPTTMTSLYQVKTFPPFSIPYPHGSVKRGTTGLSYPLVQLQMDLGWDLARFSSATEMMTQTSGDLSTRRRDIAMTLE
ncbi:hypothetical protein D9758_005761 [Tetrapyrgos nigripes]|uniref:Uncharacterized protein n=1 Tax=Tetrapyrgos nigripes TaxID=182062 RepID=A0A8H5LR10_9AGAR|nr:hypothetical protein D9758_005761 [Tetrapyrgos nigripes]